MSLPLVPTKAFDIQQKLYLLSETLNSVIRGRANVASSLTLAAGVTSTVVTDPAFESSMVPVLTPTTANAAAALPTTYVSARDKGAFTLTHANTATLDRTFLYVRWG